MRESCDMFLFLAVLFSSMLGGAAVLRYADELRFLFHLDGLYMLGLGKPEQRTAMLAAILGANAILLFCVTSTRSVARVASAILLVALTLVYAWCVRAPWLPFAQMRWPTFPMLSLWAVLAIVANIMSLGLIVIAVHGKRQNGQAENANSVDCQTRWYKFVNMQRITLVVLLATVTMISYLWLLSLREGGRWRRNMCLARIQTGKMVSPVPSDLRLTDSEWIVALSDIALSKVSADDTNLTSVLAEIARKTPVDVRSSIGGVWISTQLLQQQKRIILNETNASFAHIMDKLCSQIGATWGMESCIDKCLIPRLVIVSLGQDAGIGHF
jgi:hypothetical protein